jgi:hypothetical protein
MREVRGKAWEGSTGLVRGMAEEGREGRSPRWEVDMVEWLRVWLLEVEEREGGLVKVDHRQRYNPTGTDK